MRLWHKDLIPYLPHQQLLGQWRECCAIARNIEKNGTPNHVLVNKVMEYSETDFMRYTKAVFHEMLDRGYRTDWERFKKHLVIENHPFTNEDHVFEGWHNDRYLQQCLSNLQEKADCGAIPAEEWKRITDRWPEFQ